MTTHASWTSPVHHPFLTRPTLKRKHSEYFSSSTNSSEPSPTSAHSDLPRFPTSANTSYEVEAEDDFGADRGKRRRCDTLERDFGDMSLEKIRQQQQEERERELREQRMMRFWEMDGEVENDLENIGDVIRPAYIESPAETPPIPMGSTWYEPEKDRIIITSLDSDSDSGSPHVQPQNLDSGTTMEAESQNDEIVSRAMVEALRSSVLPLSSPSRPKDTSVVLFDSRRWGDLTPLERLTAGMQEPMYFNRPFEDDDIQMDDAMDIEP